MKTSSYGHAIDIIRAAASWNTAKHILENIAEQASTGLGSAVFEFLWCFDWNPETQRWREAGRHVTGTERKFWPPPPPPASVGLINWVHLHKTPIYAQGLKSLEAGNSDCVKNKIGNGVFTKTEYYQGHPETEDEIIIPMIFGGNVVGVINIEFYSTSNVDRSAIETLKDFGQNIAEALMICEAEKKREIALNSNLTNLKLERYTLPFFRKEKNCFFATPFSGPYLAVKKALQDFLAEDGYNVSLVNPVIGSTLIEEISNQIERSNLFIADVTSLNDNVLVEIGIAISRKRNILQIYNQSSEIPKLPFDLNNYYLSSYEETRNVKRPIKLSSGFKSQFKKSTS